MEITQRDSFGKDNRYSVRYIHRAIRGDNEGITVLGREEDVNYLSNFFSISGSVLYFFCPISSDPFVHRHAQILTAPLTYHTQSLSLESLTTL